MPEAVFRFYEELNDFLPAPLRRKDLRQTFGGSPTVKDVVEAIGVPHTEIDLILVDGESVDFSRRLKGGERVAVYPVFERLDIRPAVRLRPEPLRRPRFLLDVHLARLARYLRMAGFDSQTPDDSDDGAIVEQSLREESTVLTRDRGLLKRARLERGYWLRASKPRDQLIEVIRAFQLEREIRPFSRCLVCNSTVRPVKSECVVGHLPPRVLLTQGQFTRCVGCGRIYWPGSHFRRMQRFLGSLGLTDSAADTGRPGGGA
jgi:uncharacterized protein with PIN domain